MLHTFLTSYWNMWWNYENCLSSRSSWSSHIELSENTHVHSLLPWIKKPKVPKESVIAFGRRKNNTESLVVPCPGLYLVLGWIYSILKTNKKPFFTCIVGQDWRNSRLHSSDLFGRSWTEASVFGSKIFGQASTEGCALFRDSCKVSKSYLSPF